MIGLKGLGKLVLNIYEGWNDMATTIEMTFEEGNKVGDVAADIVNAISEAGLTASELNSLISWLYVTYKITSDVDIVPSATPDP